MVHGVVAGGGLTAVTAFVCARALVLELVVSSLRLDASLFVFPSRERDARAVVFTFALCRCVEHAPL